MTICAGIYCSAGLSQGIDTTTGSPESNRYSHLGRSLSFGVSRISQPDDFEATGLSLAFGVAGKIDIFDEPPLYLEWSGTFAQATSDSVNTASQDFGAVAYTSSVAPTGSIDLSVLTDANGAMSSATLQVIDSSGDIANIVSSAFSPAGIGNAISQFAVSETNTGGIFSALTTNGENGSAGAYGAAFDDTGYIFVSSGEGGRAAITTSLSEKISSFRHSILLSTGPQTYGDWTVTKKFGPVFRSINRTSSNLTFIDIDEGFDATAPIPNIALKDNYALGSRYYGAILGGSISRKLQNNWRVSLGAEAGLANFTSKYSGFESVNAAEVYVAIPRPNQAISGVSKMGQVSGSISRVSSNGMIFSVGAYWDYVSDVPYVATQAVQSPDLIVSGASASVMGNGETYRSHTIKRNKMTTSGLSASMTFLF